MNQNATRNAANTFSVTKILHAVDKTRHEESIIVLNAQEQQTNTGNFTLD